jgi:hypothetical protein
MQIFGFFLFSILQISLSDSIAIDLVEEKAKPFSVPLPIITTTFESNGTLIEAFVTYEGSQEGWALAFADDRYVKDTRKERLDYIYRELSTQRPYLSPFEIKVIDNVCEHFQDALSIFEKDLRDKKWGRVLYLDTYMVPFFRGFYYLIGASKCSYTTLPSNACIADSAFDLTYDSPKSKSRVSRWAHDEEHIVKLRIAAKELHFQIGKWRDNDLTAKTRDPWQDNSNACMDAFDLFLKLYLTP